MPQLRGKNVAAYLDLRSRGIFDAGTLSKLNLKILRGIVLQDSKDFTKVWTKSSKSTIFYESGRIYFENYQCCFSSLPSEPQLLYQLPKRSKAEKIEDALLCQCPLDKGLPTPSDQKPSLLALTSNNCLYRFSAVTGQQLEKVYLSPHHKFRYLGWDVSQETFYVKSIQNKVTSSARQAGFNQNTLLYLAVFRVFPLQLVGVLEINKSIFGSTVIDVVLSQGVLAVSHSTKTVKLYSFEDILNKYIRTELVLGEPCHSEGGKTVGEAPFGIPVNIHINECPPVLFEVSCFDNGVQIGGHPWHYIFTLPHKKHQGSYRICSLKDNTLAKHGIQDMKCCSLESDWIYFHPDDSGRIIHVGPSTINVLKILSELESDAQFDIVKEFSITAHRDDAASHINVTSSGRTVKRRFYQLDDDPDRETFRMVEYEDELDLLAVVEVTHREDEGKAHVRLHDNNTGALLKRVPLVESWDVTYSHELFFDRDTIVHIEQTKNNNFCCHVYKISRGQADE
ncbi:DDB1- and CUL4-associated factor 17 [Salmo salar]|uniref:DDB1- and CUL4-associated factor 17 n=1 Tax=Salmo salar TaxID=8030 RepID=A0A1S3PM21_SALSA|nr:DDB1- and CUL4-associated factor 17 [Salmo salar]|eukprot:XP_014028733.1 PREDICTED: DDB1- and CUL4-associated factor 17 [Salmo salar]